MPPNSQSNISQLPAPKLEDAVANWAGEGVRFTCQAGCTRCCGGAPGDVFVTQDEIDQIAAFLKIDKSEFEDSFVRHYSSGLMSLTERPNGDCVMLEAQGCSVYSVRPKQCRDYPFWPEIMKSRFSWLKEAQRCPGINVGNELYSVPKIANLLKSQHSSTI